MHEEVPGAIIYDRNRGGGGETEDIVALLRTL